jgi:hypothetical protein
MQHRQEYGEAHGIPSRGHASHAGYIPGLWPFIDQLCVGVWPRNFKLHDLDTYDGKANPE